MTRFRFALVASTFLVSLVLVVFGGASLELAVRVLLPQYHPEKQFRYIPGTLNRPPLGLPNSTLRHGDKSGDFVVSMTINRIGLRDKKDISQSRDVDIIALGDSFTMGFGVDEEHRYSNVLDEKIEPRVYNVAIPGSFVSYFNLLRYVEAHQSKARRLMVGVYVDNDTQTYPLDILTSTSEIEKSPVVTTSVEFEMSFNGLKRYLNRYSALYLASTTAIRKIRPLDLWLQEVGLVQPNESLRIDYDQEEFVSSARFLARMTSQYDAVIILLPSRFIWLGGHQKAIRKTHQRMKAALVNEDLDVIDVLPAFDKTEHPLSYYFPMDGHWNAAGHRLAAETIYRQLPKTWRSTDENGEAHQ